MKTTSILIATLTLLLAPTLPLLAQGGDVELPKLDELEGDRVHKLLPPDAIPSIDNPRFATVEQADDLGIMDDDEMVIGVVHQGIAKAYSVWYLDRHEIVNDKIGLTDFAVTW